MGLTPPRIAQMLAEGRAATASSLVLLGNQAAQAGVQVHAMYGLRDLVSTASRIERAAQEAPAIHWHPLPGVIHDAYLQLELLLPELLPLTAPDFGWPTP